MEQHIPAILISLSLLAAAISLLPRRRRAAPPALPTAGDLEAGRQGEQALYMALRRECPGIPFVQSFAFPCLGENGEPLTAQVDCVVKGVDTLIVVECKNWAGEVEVLPNGRWRVHRGDGSWWDSKSPYDQAGLQAKRLSRKVGAPVRPLVAMTGTARPATGHWPRGCHGLEDIPRMVGGLARNPSRDGRGADPPTIASAWAETRDLEAADAEGTVSHEHARRMAEKRREEAGRLVVASSRPRWGWAALSILLAGAGAWLLP